MKHKFYIDTHKGITPVVILILLAVYSQGSNPTAWVYLALHGTYGLLWVLKSRFFPDRSWERRVSLGYGLATWAGLSLYWIAPVILMSRGVQAPLWLLGLSTSLYALGVFFHFAADIQKFTALRLNPGALITDGLFSLSRNINYFGELLIYLAFALLPLHPLPLMVLLAFLLFVWVPNMRKKEKSLERYPEFGEYKTRTRWFIPFLF
jgi:protein-S-isoprenylcysteine O-methyltransferase Ste14